VTRSNDRIRVAIDAHVVGRRQTGNETYIVELAHALSRRDEVMTTVYVDRGAVWPNDPTPNLRSLTFRSRYVRLAVELPVRVRRDRAQLLHVQYVAPPISPVPIVAAVHDVSFLDVPGLFPRAAAVRLRATIRSTVRRAACVLALSNFTRDRIMEHYGLEPDRVVLAPGGVSPSWRRLSRPEMEASLSAATEAGQLPAHLPERFVLTIGNLQPRKNVLRLVRAVAAARASGAGDLALVLAGQRHWRSAELDEQVRRVQGDSWVHRVGYLPQDTLVALANQATLIAHPSLYEGFGLPVLEGMAAGAVVVASDATSIPEVVGDAALLVDPSSEEAMADGLVRASTDEELRRRLRQAGPLRAAEFTWDRCADGTILAYRRAMGR
jgi:glycosyltransferase involved in cell wall biosynthesis